MQDDSEHNIEDVELISATDWRRVAGDVGRSTEYRWRKTYDDYPEDIYINGRRYLRKKKAFAWLRKRFAKEAA